MLADAVAYLTGEVETVSILFQDIHHPQALVDMTETSRRQIVKNPLAGVPEGGMPQIVPKGDGFGQIFVKGQGAGDGARDLGDFQGVSETGSVVIALRREEDLRLVLEPPERFAMNDSVAIMLKGRPDRAGSFCGPATRAS
jgi:hypothetical protein